MGIKPGHPRVGARTQRSILRACRLGKALRHICTLPAGWPGQVFVLEISLDRCSERCLTHYGLSGTSGSCAMPWRETSILDERREFVRFALQDGANRRELCRRFGISPDADYRWLARWKAGDEGLADRSHRPATSPRRSEGQIETRVLAVRDEHPAWGARKIVRVLQREGSMRRRSRRCMRSCSATNGLSRRSEARAPRRDLKSRRPTSFGRWTSKGG